MKQNKTVKQIILNTVTGWGALAIKGAIGLIMVPFMIGQLGKEGYGLIGLLGVIVSLSEVADLGLRNALGRELAEQVVKKDGHAFNELASSALILYLCISLILATLGWILAPWLVAFFKVSPELRDVAVSMIRVFGTLSVIFSFILPVFKAGLSSNHRFDVVNNIAVVGGILTSLGLLVVLPRAGNALYAWVGVMLAYNAINLVLYYIFFRKLCVGGRIGIRFINFSRLRPLFHLGGYMYVLQLTRMLAMRSDPLVLSYFLGPAAIALYKAGAKINELVRPAVMTLSDQVHPLTTKYHIQDNRNNQHRLLIDGTKYTLYLGTISSLGIFFFAQSFSRLWLFDKLGQECLTVARVMQLWALAHLVNYSGAMHWPVTLGMKKMGFALAIQIPSAVINLGLSIYFVGFTDAGIPGVLYATVLTEILRRPIAVWYVAKITKLNLVSYLWRGYAPAAVYILVVAVPGYFLWQSHQVSGWVGFGVAVVTFLLYALSVLLVLERRVFRELLATGRERFGLKRAKKRREP